MFLEIYKAIIAAYLTIALAKITFVAVLGALAKLTGGSGR